MQLSLFGHNGFVAMFCYNLVHSFLNTSSFLPGDVSIPKCVETE